jgi:hypothetical protein
VCAVVVTTVETKMDIDFRYKKQKLELIVNGSSSGGMYGSGVARSAFVAF